MQNNIYLLLTMWFTYVIIVHSCEFGKIGLVHHTRADRNEQRWTRILAHAVGNVAYIATFLRKCSDRDFVGLSIVWFRSSVQPRDASTHRLIVS